MRTKADSPTDRGHLVAISFFVFGLGTLLPWNFFMTASEYFDKRLSTSEWSNDTISARKEYYFNNWMTLLSQLPLLLFTLLNSILYPRISEMVRIGGSLVFILLLFILTAILVKVPMDKDYFFSITMTTIWFINSFGAVLQGSLFGLLGLLPQKYSAVFMSGQGLAGTFAALALLFAIASKADDKNAALGYFITPCFGTLVTLLCYWILPRLEFAKFYLHKSKKQSYEMENKLLTQETTQDKEELRGHSMELLNGTVSDLKGDIQDLDIVEVPDSNETKSSVLEVFKKIWVMAFCVTIVFTVTLSVFPAVAVEVKTVNPGTWDIYFTPVCCFLDFNLMDWTGRSVTTFVQWPSKESRLFPALVISRVIFIPLFMLCNVWPRHSLPVLITYDLAFVMIMALFAISNGYCVSLSMSYAPQLVSSNDAETAGALMTFFLALGLSLGASLSFLLRSII